jgi:hypothetical protein
VAVLFLGGALLAAVSVFAGWPGLGQLGRWLAIAGVCAYAVRRRSLTTWILVSMIVGAEIGHDWPDVGVNLRVLSQIFLRMIKTIIAPLIFGTLVGRDRRPFEPQAGRPHGREGPHLLRGRHHDRAVHRPGRHQHHQGRRRACSRRP